MVECFLCQVDVKSFSKIKTSGDLVRSVDLLGDRLETPVTSDSTIGMDFVDAVLPCIDGKPGLADTVDKSFSRLFWDWCDGRRFWDLPFGWSPNFGVNNAASVDSLEAALPYFSDAIIGLAECPEMDLPSGGYLSSHVELMGFAEAWFELLQSLVQDCKCMLLCVDG